MVLDRRAGGVPNLSTEPDLERAASLAFSGIDAQHQNHRERCSTFADRIFCAADSLAPSAHSSDLDRRIVCLAVVSAAKELPVPRVVLLNFLYCVCGTEGKELLPRAHLPSALCRGREHS